MPRLTPRAAERWRIQRTPNPAGARVSALADVACTAPSSCTAVGDWVISSGAQLPLAELACTALGYSHGPGTR
jgi:hypothetical protein